MSYSHTEIDLMEREKLIKVQKIYKLQTISSRTSQIRQSNSEQFPNPPLIHKFVLIYCMVHGLLFYTAR